MSWRSTREYRLWRALVIRRDGKCIICGSMKRRQAHHINNGAHHPEERYDVDNGVTLCSECHSQYHNNFNRSYRVKTTRHNWDNFLELIKYLKGVL